MTAKKLYRHQARWSLYLAHFDFRLVHRPGRSMGKPDTLSQRPDHGKGPPTTKTWSSYDQSSLQSELSKEFSWKDWNETSLGKFVKRTRRATRKSQWQRQRGNFSKHWVRRSAPRNGQRTAKYSSSEARSMFLRMQTYEDE